MDYEGLRIFMVQIWLSLMVWKKSLKKTIATLLLFQNTNTINKINLTSIKFFLKQMENILHIK